MTARHPRFKLTDKELRDLVTKDLEEACARMVSPADKLRYQEALKRRREWCRGMDADEQPNPAMEYLEGLGLWMEL